MINTFLVPFLVVILFDKFMQSDAFCTGRSHCRSYTSFLSKSEKINLADDEPLSSRFQRAVVLQRAGDYLGALGEYETFIKVAKSCYVNSEAYAEVHVNMGAIYVRMKKFNQAKSNFLAALSYRDMSSAHINLALLALSEGQKSSNSIDGIKALETARMHCQRAIEIDDDNNATQLAKKLMSDFEEMMQKNKE